MTYDEFLAWADEDTRAEWVDGEVIVFMPSTIRHLLLVGFLFRLLSAYVERTRLGLVFSERLDMRAPNRGPIRQPDVVVVLNEHLERLARSSLQGPADLIVEVVSDDSVERDTSDKLAEYAALGVPEYWIVEGREGQQGVALHVRTAAGAYEQVSPDAEGRLPSTVLLGFWLDPAWLAADPLPDVDDVLDEIVPGIHEERAAHAKAQRARRSSAPS
jgi:Uma2 family endonuclease